MIDLLQAAADRADEMLYAAWKKAAGKGEWPDRAGLTGTVSLSRDPARGDFTANHALQSAGALHLSPREAAALLAAYTALDRRWFSSLEAAGPGFLNFYLGEGWYAEVLTSLAAVPYPEADELSVNAARFFSYLSPAPGPDRMARQDLENPLYFVRYTYARIGSMMAASARDGNAVPKSGITNPPSLTGAEERALIKRLAALPGELRFAGRDSGRVCRYVIGLAEGFRRFYVACPIRDVPPAVREARLLLAGDVRRAIVLALDRTGVLITNHGFKCFMEE